MSDSITLINAFSVPPAESDRFLLRWKEHASIMTRQPGFIRAWLHRAISDDAELRFVNVAEWASAEAFEAALGNPVWQASVQVMLEDPELHITPRPSTYHVEIELHPGDDA
ncbi:antibiotic biosynthesis monooxygenase family protein [Nonomuraea sp. NPDC050536]|uniref:antibiotic biosynthesis monooxygenase family protein n=1 Tax=Nonomuraea sp. NPDC050536 TaxID=3364366 RepID=UPI0037C8E193